MELTSKLKEASDTNSDASSIKVVDWEKYKLLIQGILKEKFPNNTSTKWRVSLKKDRLNFSCPYCGDSHNNERKKRANIYLKTGKFKCYNSTECPKPNLRNFLKDFNALQTVNLDEISTLIELEKSYVPNKFNAGFSTQIQESTLLSSCALHIDEVVIGLKLLPISVWIKNYLNNRLQVDDKRFWMDSQMNLYIFNMVNDYVLGVQIRSFKPNAANKYITYKLNKLYDLLDKEIPETEDFELLDEVSSFFGWFTVDTDKPIIVFEGPMDHFLMKNSIAQCSVGATVDTNIGEFKFLYDNDAPGRKALMEKINEGYSIFLWNKFLKNYNLPEKTKDFNDVLLELKKRNLGYPKDILSYFSKSKYELYDL